MPPIDSQTLLVVAFVAIVVVALAVDLGLLRRAGHEPTVREALAWTIVWISLAIGFGVALSAVRGGAAGIEYATAYLVEYSLSIDNVFVFTLVFAAFAVPPALRGQLLLWGVIGALVMRLVMILAGVALIERFEWILLVFGALLLVTAIRFVRREEGHADPRRNAMVRLVERFLPVTGYHGPRLLTRVDGRLAATPLLLALVVIESGDLVFALDSIPAVFGITTDPLVIFTSNAFAVLGLRSLAVVVADAAARLRYLRQGLAGVLGFVGLKLMLTQVVHLPALLSLCVIAAILLLAGVASLLAERSGSPPAGSEVPAVPDRPAGSARPATSRRDRTSVRRGTSVLGSTGGARRHR